MSLEETGHRRLDLYASAVRMDLVSLTQARVELGTTSWWERFGYRWPWLFRAFAAENERRDRKHRAYRAEMDAFLAKLDEQVRGS